MDRVGITHPSFCPGLWLFSQGAYGRRDTDKTAEGEFVRVT